MDFALYVFIGFTWILFWFRLYRKTEGFAQIQDLLEISPNPFLFTWVVVIILMVYHVFLWPVELFHYSYLLVLRLIKRILEKLSKKLENKEMKKKEYRIREVVKGEISIFYPEYMGNDGEWVNVLQDLEYNNYEEYEDWHFEDFPSAAHAIKRHESIGAEEKVIIHKIN